MTGLFVERVVDCGMYQAAPTSRIQHVGIIVHCNRYRCLDCVREGQGYSQSYDLSRAMI